MSNTAREHWNRVYQTKAATEVSWYRAHLDTSLGLVEQALPDRTSAIIDVGGGASTLVDDLVGRGYRDVTVLDIARYDAQALHAQFGPRFEMVRHLEEIHRTPLGREQQFVWCVCRLRPNRA